ncbi:bifunctional lytic transglycosylase/C40 family peptidase [Bacillus massiliglaciei]|uniref:bifunctional lytic transglycosylase/C40 family peptidase n=1 Tax=Bacillus massiliglaciei TaxID=1816693 RepID=UPI000A91EB35|nr:bifunctional lytic transglycosylase/C40 family peptidase [Bacillus massiliglaciei]
MEPVTTVKVALTVAQQAKKHWKKIVLIALSIFMLLIFGVMALLSSSSGSSGTANVNEAVMALKPAVIEYAGKYEIPEYVDVILAIIMIETGGKGPDVMQSSESLGLPPNSISDPLVSIDAGVKHLAEVIKDARSSGLDFWTPVQSYNFGTAFNGFIKKNGKQYTFDLASNYAKDMANGKKVKYSNPVAKSNGNFRYSYGNMYYVMLVQSYLSPAAGGDIGNADASALGPEAYQALMAEVLKYNGWTYVWGGSSPNTGFDCSGLMQYSFRQLGYDLPRTAAEQEKHSIPVAEPQPGDLVFFKGTNSSRGASAITHVGIYVDDQRFYAANSSGVGYAKWNSGYWGKHFAGFGRVVK